MKKKQSENHCSKGKLPKLYKAHGCEGRAQTWEIWVERDKDSPELGVMVTRYGIEGGKLQTTREVIREGKNEGRKNATTPFEQACLEASARHTKQRDRKGYAENLGAAVSKKSLRPMLAGKYQDHVGKIDWGTALAQPKFNGYRANFRREKGEVVCFSREGKRLQVPHLCEILDAGLGEGVVVDGELYRHGLSLPQISSACKRKQDLTDSINLHLYDIFSGDPYTHRYAEIEAIVAQINTDPTGPPKNDKGQLVLAPTVKVRTPQELMYFQGECIKDGYEGAMLRHGRAGYEAGHRSASLLKVKTFEDAEFIITDYKFGRGKYEGMPVFVCQTEEGNLFDVLAPGNHEQKRELGLRASSLVGCWVKVKYAEMTKTAEPVPYCPVALQILDADDVAHQGVD